MTLRENSPLRITLLVLPEGPVPLQMIAPHLGRIDGPSRQTVQALTPCGGEDIELPCLDGNLSTLLVQDVQAEYGPGDDEDALPRRLLLHIA